MLLVLCRRVRALAERLWDGVCPSRWGYMMMGLTRIWPEPGKNCVKSSRRTCAAAPDNRWSNKKHDLSDVLLFDRVWLSLYSLLIFLLSWGCEQKALGCFSTVWSCMWLHGHSTVCKHNLTEAQTPTSVHMCTQREVVDCHRQGKDTSKWYSNLYHHRHHHIHHDFTSKLLWQTAPEASIMPGRTVLLLLLHIWALTVF